ncbi:MAG: hypothetical protein ACXACU_16345 [Candidatus Hodarchaeales archaeon]|jgi:hypothetical protein
MAKEEGRSGKLFKKIKDTSKEFIDGVKEEVDEATASTREKGKEYRTVKTQELKTSLKTRVSDTSSPEDVYYSTWAWLWAMVFSVIICLAIFMVSLTNPKFLLMGILALIAMPFLVIWCLIHTIPTIKIFGFTIFDRHKLSLRRQLSLGKEIARVFSREFLDESPMIAFLFFAFVVIFILSIAIAFIP